MVIKGRARGGPAALATHLERRDTNEWVRVRALEGVTARDLRGALREMDCMGSGAASTRTLYHAAINTAPGEDLTDEQKRRAIERLEQELGFAGQPRVVVEHRKKDREHIHAVFLRIDTDRMVAITDSHNYRKHETVARDLEREFGHQHVQGAHIGREDGEERPKRTPGHEEMQQADRTGLTPQQATEQVTRLWTQADSGKAFAAALAAKGWVLARGDRRDFVLVDRAGETHSLARRIDGVKAAEVRQRMSDVDPSRLPSVAEARTIQRTPSPGVPNKSPQDKVIVASVSTSEPLKVKNTAPPKPLPRPIQTKAERITDVAKATVVKGSASPEQIREALNLKKTSTSKPPPKSSPFRKLYTIAADATLRAYAKARSFIEGKPKPAKPVKRQAPSRVAAATVQSAAPPVQKTPTAKREAGRPGDRQPSKTAIIKSTNAPPKKLPLPASANQDQGGDRTRDIKPARLSREELDLMIGHRRQQREERKGPSR